MLIRSYMSGSMQLLSTAGTYLSRKTLRNSSKDCRIKQKMGTPDTGLRWISLWSPKQAQTWLLYKPNRVLSWTDTSVMLSWIYTTTIFTFLFKSNQFFFSVIISMGSASIKTLLKTWKYRQKYGQEKLLRDVPFIRSHIGVFLVGTFNFLTTEHITGNE